MRDLVGTRGIVVGVVGGEVAVVYCAVCTNLYCTLHGVYYGSVCTVMYISVVLAECTYSTIPYYTILYHTVYT